MTGRAGTRFGSNRPPCGWATWVFAVAVACLVLVVRPDAAAAADAQEIAALAERAKERFRRRMHPPAPFLTLLQVIEREETSAVRDYALHAYEDAVDALAAEAARSPARADAVEAALRRFVATGKPDLADAIYTDIVRKQSGDGGREAVAIRHSVALAELPAALAPMIKMPGEALPLPPLGGKALPAFVRAADLDPEEPWTHLAIAWMLLAGEGSTTQVDTAVDLAERGGLVTGDREATIAALQTRGQLRAAQGHFADAARALREAVRLSEGRPGAAGSEPADLALRLNLLGDVELRGGNASEAARAFARAFELRRRLAAADPQDGTAQLNLVVSHARLAMLAERTGVAEAARGHWQQAFALYHAVASRNRFLPTLDAAQPGTVFSVFVMAGVLTLVGGILLLARYRRAVDRLMKATARTTTDGAVRAAQAADGGGTTPVDLPVRTLQVAGPKRASSAARGGAPQSPPIAGARRAIWKAAAVQVLAGAAFAAVATLLMFKYAGIEYLPIRAAVIFWTWLWPVVVVVALLWGRDRERFAEVLAVYLGGLLVMCAVVAASDTPPLDVFGIPVPAFFQPLLFWAMGIVYSLFLLFFLNRSIRSVGPVLLVFTLIASIGGMLAMVAMSMYAAMDVLSAGSAALGVSMEIIMLAVPLLGMIVLAVPAWWVIGGIRRAYEAKRISDLTLMVDGIWLFQALVLCQSLISETGLVGWIGLAAFAAYKGVAIAGQRSLAAAAAASRRPAARLLLLRVFGFRGRSERLFDVLAARWRFAGPIQMIAAPDLAARTIDPGEFIDFLSGRLRRRFIIEPHDLTQRLEALDLQCDADGRFRVNDLFCGNDTWQAAVQGLMALSDLVAMDLRGFSPEKKGCVFELGVLLNTVPAGRIVLLADRSTDLAFLERTLADRVRQMAPSSPNRAGCDALTILDVGGDERAAVRALLSAADAALLAPAGSNSP